jgi:hypothetical protein
MSGRDETFVPPDLNGTEPPPYPPTPAPPSFGQSAPAEEPLVVFQAADAPPGVRNFSGPSVAPDAEETMTPPPPRPGTPVPDAEKTMTAPPPYDPAAAGTPTGIPYEAMPPHSQPVPPGAERIVADARPDAETTRTDVRDTGAEQSMAMARFGAEAPHGEPGPALTPDAILPPGITPEAPPEPPHDIGATSTGPIPRLGSGASFPPGGPPGAGPGGRPRGSSGPRRALLAGGGLLGVLLAGGAVVLGYTELSGSPSKDHTVARSSPPPAPTPVRPTPTRAKAKPKPKPPPQPVDIRDEKKDPAPLTIGEVFPGNRVSMGGHTFFIVKTVINDHCNLTANRPFADELTRQHCRRVVRATYVSGDKALAVTTGIAVMPTDASAVAALKAQDAAHYKWFRGMKAPGAPKIDQAGGFAASTMRGRYIPYAYATYADGHKPAAKDQTLKNLGNGFRDATARSIDRRAKS